jgi:hypothetical protein
MQPLALAPLQLPVDQSRAAPPLTGFVPNQAPGAPVSPIPVTNSLSSCHSRHPLYRHPASDQAAAVSDLNISDERAAPPLAPCLLLQPSWHC